MRAWWKKAIGCLILVGVLTSQLAVPMAAKAQIDDTGPAYQGIVGGVEISVEDIAAAVESPTPNLANTTAYIMLTITWLLNGSVNPQSLKVASDAVEAPGADPEVTYSIPRSVDQALESGGMIGGLTYYMGEMIRYPPASGSRYVAKVVRDSRFSPEPVYAQGFGIGFGALDPILETWAAFRDVAYFLLTVMFLVTGLLIIFRKKVSGNVAVSVQNALPRLVITLILITFSYAIAGFVVDLMFWAVYFTVFIFSSLFESSPMEGTSLVEMALDKSIFHIFFEFLTAGSASNVADALADTVVSGGISAILPIGDDDVVAGIFKWIVGNIFMLVIGVAMLIQVFRVFFQLLMSYAGFVINVVLSPFILLQGAWPGKNPFQKWFLNLIAGLAPFVVVVFMLFMAFTLAGTNTKTGVGYDPDAADQTGLRLPLILTQDFNPAAMLGVLSMGFVMLLPEAVGMTKKMLGVSGGPLDEFKDKAMGNLAQGWKGGQAVPGLGFTKVPGASNLQRVAFGSEASRKATNAKPQAERSTWSRLRGYGALPGLASVVKTEGIAKPYARWRQTNVEGQVPSQTPTPIVAANRQTLPATPTPAPVAGGAPAPTETIAEALARRRQAERQNRKA